MRLTRRQALAGAATGALGAAGVYELVDRLAGPSERKSAPESAEHARPEQHVLGGVQVIVDDGVEVVVPPLHHEVVTARVTAGTSRRALRDAQAGLTEGRLAGRAEDGVLLELGEREVVRDLTEHLGQGRLQGGADRRDSCAYGTAFNALMNGARGSFARSTTFPSLMTPLIRR